MYNNRQSVLILGDLLVLIASFLSMAALRFDFSTDGAFIALQAQSFLLLFLIWLVVFFIFDLYTINRINPSPRNIGFLVLAIATNTIVGIIFFYFFPTIGVSPKFNLLLVSVLAFIFLVAWRRLFYQLLAQKFKRHIIVIGTSSSAEQLIAEIKKQPHVGSIIAVLDHVPGEIIEQADLIIAEPSKPLELLLAARTINCEIVSLTQASEHLFGKLPLSLMTDERAMTIISKNNTDYIGITLIYRMVGVLIAVSILLIASPFLLIAMIALYIEDGGPLFYRQERVGKHGHVFTLYKLRSMIKDAEQNGAQWATTNDPRITLVGRILRSSHIDEVPQMINIIKGDIALIGPRPERPELVSELQRQIPYYFLRHTITPGFTGWAQIKFRYARSVMDSKEKFEYDLYYLANKNILIDVGILLKTVQIVFTH